MCRSVSLLLQAVLPCLHFTAGPTECHLIGGTNADLAPPIDYIEKVTIGAVLMIRVEHYLDICFPVVNLLTSPLIMYSKFVWSNLAGKLAIIS